MMTRTRRFGGGALAVVTALLASCGADEHVPLSSGADASAGALALGITESSAARARIGELRGRFAQEQAVPTRGGGTRRAKRPALGAAVATGFERSDAGGLRAVMPAAARRGVARPASVELPMHADGEARLEDGASRVSVRFRLRDAKPSAVDVADGYALYAGALGGADVVHRVHAEGTEDYVVYETPPAREELRYDVDVSRVAGLRLASNTLEFLDDGGSPALRIAPPYVVDAKGARHAARLSVEGCAYEASPAPPWRRPVTPPGAGTCAIHVAWSAIAYPLVVDPSWVATGSMVTTRYPAFATLLPSGRVLVVGGGTASAELYDPDTKTFAATGSTVEPGGGSASVLLMSGKVLVLTSTATPELYDPVSGTFGVTGTMSSARVGASVARLASGSVLVAAGGDTPSTPIATADLYDPATAAFTATGPMGVARFGGVTTLLPSNKVLITGGTVAAYPYQLSSAEIYDPTAGAFGPVKATLFAHAGHTATLLQTGKVLLVGQLYGSGVNTGEGAELYDPVSDTFTAAGGLAFNRMEHTASVLPSGRVLLVGGRQGANHFIITPTVEVYDPALGTFATYPPMNTERAGHAAVWLGTGSLLELGGRANGASASAELLFVASGAPCKTGDDCASQACEDGICCATPCAGACKTCKIGTGACVSVTNADDPDTCAGTSTCDATGSCKQKNGEACPNGQSSCASGFCAGGVCCDVACDGACQTCSAPGRLGACGVVAAGDPGAGGACAPLVCDGQHPTCPTSCASDGDCAKGDVCNVTKHTCGTGGSCDGDHTATNARGVVHDCAPYRCDPSGACKQPCHSIDDCAYPNGCDPSGDCVAPRGDGGGGGCSAAPGSSTLGTLAVAALLALILRHRTRRQARGR